jgi:hypothetical protein
VGFGDVRICTYLYLFSDQSASFFDSTRCSFSILLREKKRAMLFIDPFILPSN